MNQRMTCLLAFPFLAITVLAQTPSTTSTVTQRSGVRGQLPAGWSIPDPGAGSVPEAYEVGLDRTVKHSGNASAYIKAATLGAQGGFMALTQGIRAEQYRGKRLMFSGYIRTQEVVGSAGLWVQIGGGGGSVGFDNMRERPDKGTMDWAKYEVVLDVPENSVAVAFGFRLSGPGQAWVDDLNFEVVGQNVPVTNMPAVNRTNPANVDAQARAAANMPTQPVNLDFEKLNP